MYVSPIQTSFSLKTGCVKRKRVSKPNSYPNDIFIRKSNPLSFRGKPAELDYYDFGVSRNQTISAQKAIEIYDELKYHKYTDVPQPNWYNHYEPPYNEIREHNLRFLDQIKSDEDKQEFIEYFEQLTGFPDLETCSQKILNEFYTVVKGGIRELEEQGIHVKLTDIGYNNTCSVGHKKALPGSDLDGSYVILDASNTYCSDTNVVNRFKEYLWNNTDARILSYNHLAAFPQVYTKKQVESLLKSLDSKTRQMNLPKKVYSHGLFRNTSMQKHYENLQKTYNNDYVDANQFCIALSKNLEDNCWFDYDNPSRELAKNFGFLVETILNGISLSPDGKLPKEASALHAKVRASQYAKLVNLSQLYILKKNPPPKPKLVARDKLIEKYKTSSTKEKYEIVREIIRASCGHNDSRKFAEYFACGSDKFTPLLNALKGD